MSWHSILWVILYFVVWAVWVKLISAVGKHLDDRVNEKQSLCEHDFVQIVSKRKSGFKSDSPWVYESMCTNCRLERLITKEEYIAARRAEVNGEEE